jgi:predicted CoA-binding protein
MSTHPLQQILDSADGFVLIGDSSEDRFPAYSYDSYTRAGKRFHCLDLGGVTESRGPTKGGKVYTSVDELPADRSDLAIIWVTPKSASNAVQIAHSAGCKRVWFSFGTGHRDAVAKAGELGMEVVEIGRCPVYYLDGGSVACKAHRMMVRVTGTRRKAPQLDPDAKHREIY